jgi:hypothetical protein
MYKTKYRVANWTSYDRALVGRGDVTLWVSPVAITTWAPAGVGTRGGQRQYSDVAIETALTLRLVFHLPLRQTEGFLQSLFGMMGLARRARSHNALAAWPAPRPHSCSSPDGQGPASDRRQHGTVDRGRRRVCNVIEIRA